ncbi:MAG: transcription-repair coupling factor, partial [Lachnospiraceae bacterium]|nr:transcription-repair coupling factor [Lachnospiraceae bacterium]
MRAFTAPMQQLGEFEDIIRKTAGNRGLLQVTGCIDSQKSHFVYCVSDKFCSQSAFGPVTLIITYNDLRAKEMYENYRFFDPEVLYFPAKDLIFFQADIHSNLLEQQRIQVLKRLVERTDSEIAGKPLTIITTIAACMNRMPSFEEWKEHI